MQGITSYASDNQSVRNKALKSRLTTYRNMILATDWCSTRFTHAGRLFYCKF